MSDKIDEIRDRHSKRSEIDQSGCYRLDGFTYTGSLAQSQEDVDTLLAEVDSQRAEVERLRADRRERIATAALQGILACQEGNTALPKEWPGIFAIMSVNCADALIAKLDKEEGKP